MSAGRSPQAVVPLVSLVWLLNGETWRNGAWGNGCKAAFPWENQAHSCSKQTLTIGWCNKRLWHGEKPQGEARHHKNSLQSHFFLHLRASLCSGGSSCAGGKVREGFGGVWGGGEADCVLQGEGGISRNFEEFGNR